MHRFDTLGKCRMISSFTKCLDHYILCQINVTDRDIAVDTNALKKCIPFYSTGKIFCSIGKNICEGIMS